MQKYIPILYYIFAILRISIETTKGSFLFCSLRRACFLLCLNFHLSSHGSSGMFLHGKSSLHPSLFESGNSSSSRLVDAISHRSSRRVRRLIVSAVVFLTFLIYLSPVCLILSFLNRQYLSVLTCQRSCRGSESVPWSSQINNRPRIGFAMQQRVNGREASFIS